MTIETGLATILNNFKYNSLPDPILIEWTDEPYIDDTLLDTFTYGNHSGGGSATKDIKYDLGTAKHFMLTGIYYIYAYAGTTDPGAATTLTVMISQDDITYHTIFTNNVSAYGSGVSSSTQSGFSAGGYSRYLRLRSQKNNYSSAGGAVNLCYVYDLQLLY